MEKQDIMNILDALDLQISMGKIDLSNYNQLKKKWQDQLQKQETGGAKGPVTGPVSGPLSGPLPSARPLTSFSGSYPNTGPVGPMQRQTAEALVCPKCGAP